MNNGQPKCFPYSLVHGIGSCLLLQVHLKNTIHYKEDEEDEEKNMLKTREPTWMVLLMVYCHFQKYESNPAASVTYAISSLDGGMMV